MSVKSINDIIYEYETCEYSQENLDITRDILNLELLEEKVLASEFFNENYDVITESVDLNYFMETFEEPKKIANNIIKKGKSIYNTIVKSAKGVVNTVIKFTENKTTLVMNLVTPAANIKKYIANKPFNEKAANAIKKALDSAKKAGNVTPANKQAQEISLGNFSSALGDCKNDLAVALNGTVTVMGNNSESEVGPVDISKLSYYLAQASTGSDSVYKGLKTSITDEAKKAANSGVNLVFDKTFSKSINQLKKIEAKLAKVLESPASSSGVEKESDKLTDAQEIGNTLKKVVAATMKLYSTVLNYRKSFISSISKSLLNAPLNFVKGKTKEVLDKASNALSEGFEDYDLSEAEEIFSESFEEDEEYEGYDFNF